MSTSRRAFIGSAMAAGTIAAVAGHRTFASTGARRVKPVENMKEGLTVGEVAGVEDATDKLKVLILGGTGFLGPHIVQYAVARGHDVTIFTRGKTNPHLFPDGIEKLTGDRDPNKGTGLTALEGKTWDVVIDTSSYFPRITKASCELLKNSVKHYCLITTISVYKDHATSHADESYPLGTIDDPTMEEITGGSYGPLKALCEQAAEEIMPGRVAHVRPGLIVGPRDYSDRFTYWPVRVQRGGEVMAPGNPTDPSQWIDARDLAAFCVKSVEDKMVGPFNAVGPVTPSNIGEIILGCKAVMETDATFTWVPAEFLEAHSIGAWMQMPVWVPAEGDSKGIMTANIDKAIAAGLKTRPVGDTILDTLNWWNGLPEEKRNRPMRAGISADKEATTLAAWHSSQESSATPSEKTGG